MSDEFKPFKTKKKIDNEFNTWSIDNHISSKQRNEQEKLQEQEKIKHDAFNHGYQDGLEKATTANQEYSQQILRVIDVLNNPYNLIDKEVEEQLLQTLLWLCKTCIKIELSTHPDKIRAVIEEIKPYFGKIYEKKRLYLNHISVEMIKQCLKSEETDISESIIEDDTLSVGEYRLKTDSSELDGRFETRFHALIEQKLLDNQ
jgi:flagellar assembly protein FliH